MKRNRTCLKLTEKKTGFRHKGLSSNLGKKKTYTRTHLRDLDYEGMGQEERNMLAEATLDRKFRDARTSKSVDQQILSFLFRKMFGRELCARKAGA